MSKKGDYAIAVVDVSTRAAQVAEECKTLFDTYFDREYNGGGSDVLTDPDIPADLGIAAADVAAFITFAENYGKKMVENLAVFQSDYGSTLNNIRNDL